MPDDTRSLQYTLDDANISARLRKIVTAMLFCSVYENGCEGIQLFQVCVKLYIINTATAHLTCIFCLQSVEFSHGARLENKNLKQLLKDAEDCAEECCLSDLKVAEEHTEK